MALEFVSAIFSVVFDHSIAPIGRQFGYVLNYKSNKEKLKNELEKLTDTKEKIQHSVDAATRNAEEIEQVVQKWLTSVSKITEDARKIITECEEKEQQRCLKGLCFDPKSRHQLSRKAAKEAKNVAELQREGGFEKVSYRLPPQGMGITSVKGYEDFESRKHTLDGVVEALRDPSVNMIGVYGMGGVGKTTLVKEVARKAKQYELFDMVVTAEVSQYPDTRKIQGEIADELGLQFHEETVPGRAKRLCDRLKKEKRILVVLDNIWAKLDFGMVGIPSGDDHKGCKILLTSRDENVLLAGMDAQKTFLVGVLQEEEAWDLFQKKAGDSVKSPDLRSIAVEVAKKCADLPIAIVTVASALKNKKNPSEWRDALLELKRPSSRNFTGIPAVAYATIELSYNLLESEELKTSFLLYGLMPYPNISDFLKYGMGLSLFQGINSMEEARDRVHTLSRNLEASCLLVSCSDFVAMHDLVRDVAISIASRDHRMLAIRNDNLPDLPEDCPKLEFFFFYCMHLVTLKMPEIFFTRMRKLRVLDFTRMHILSLPSSLHHLVNLQTLCLDECLLGDIALVGELKKLQVLSLKCSNLEQLPKELGQLTQLQLLDLTDCSKLKVIPPGILSSLSRLEELYMANSFDRWEDEGLSSQRRNCSLAELKHLPQLTTLETRVRDAGLMPKDLFFKKLERFQIFIGEVWDWSEKYDAYKILKLKYSGTSSRLEDGIYMLLKKSEDLYLDDLKGVGTVICKLDREGFRKLKRLHVRNSPEIRFIINSMERSWASLNAFPILESLFLDNLINLEKICQSKHTVHESLSKLRKIKVECCEKLKNLFSFSMAKGLLQLQEIEVTDCKNITEIVILEIQDEIVNNEAAEKFELPQLRSLTLRNLAALVSFYSKGKTPSTSTSTSSNPMPLLDEKILSPVLEAMKPSSSDIENIWQDQLSTISSSFQSLTSLILEGCDSLKYLLSSSMARSLLQLKHLEVCECKMLEEIVVTKEVREEEKKDRMFPQLTFLKMKDLENLSRFCSEDHIGFPSLKQLHIESCPELKTFNGKSRSPGLVASKELKEMNKEEICTSTESLFNATVAFPMLEELVVLHMDNLNNIWHNQLSVDSFWKMRRIEVEDCKKLCTVFPACLARSLLNLEELMIDSCGVEYIVAKEEGVEAATEFVFPQVSVLDLYNLPELKSFYPGIHSSEWPMLKTLDVYHCDKLKVFAPKESLSSNGTQEDLQLDVPIQQPLLFVETVIPNLETLALNGEDIQMINQHGEFPPDLFCKIKSLEVQCFHHESAVVPLGFLQRFQNLEELELSCSTFNELFSYEALVGGEKDAGIFTRIRTLRLWHLSSLKHIWKQDCGWEPVLQNVETLEMRNCDSLIKLAPSSTSLQNLTTLDVYACQGLINLVTSSTAKSLVQLKIMEISECPRVTEIVSNNDGDETKEEEILFTKLEVLVLENLSRLSSFCSANYTLKFPTLVGVCVIGCPNLKIFSQGVLSTPLLHRVWLTREADERCWEGDLNTTVQFLFTKRKKGDLLANTT